MVWKNMRDATQRALATNGRRRPTAWLTVVQAHCRQSHSAARLEPNGDAAPATTRLFMTENNTIHRSHHAT